MLGHEKALFETFGTYTPMLTNIKKFIRTNFKIWKWYSIIVGNAPSGLLKFWKLYFLVGLEEAVVHDW